MPSSEPVRLWDSPEAAAAWQRGAALRASSMAGPTERMLELAGLKPGDRVLDVAAGTGDQSLAAARRVGPTGSVLATDISASMLEIAAREARAAGLANVETLAVDAEQLSLPAESFDAAISRNGLMFMLDLGRVLGIIRAALKPGGKLAAVVWSVRERNPYTTVPQDVLRRLRPELLDRSGMANAFSLAEPGRLESALAGAGFVDVAVERVPIVRRFDSASALVEQMRGTFSAVSSLLRSLEPAEQERAWAEIERAFGPFEGADGCAVPGESLVGVGARPA
jgi:SAM-dependent methyltransferase